MVEKSTEFPHILLVEDSDDDATLICTEFRSIGIGNWIDVCPNGESALRRLHEEDEKPVVVLLDLNLPGLSGLEVLRRLRVDGRTRRLPVVVLTHSDELADELRSYELGVNAYVRKDDLKAEIVTLARQLGLFLCFTSVPCVDTRAT